MDPGVQAAQAELAGSHGVSAFCYYHYWFQGKRLLERPIEQILSSRRPDFPFCLAWANEPWTRAWDGGERQILVHQAYDENDHRAHAEHLAGIFADPRYLRVEGRPVFLVYKISRIPNTRDATLIWRSVWEEKGISQPYLIRMESDSIEVDDPTSKGFDAAMEFQPAWRDMRLPDNAALRYLLRLVGRRIPAVFDYSGLAKKMAARPQPPWIRFPGVAPMWDNTCRRQGRGLILKNSTPEAYGLWLASCMEKASRLPVRDPLVFVNAWNEWGEGCHLEPDKKHGRAYLNETLRRSGKVE